MSTDVTLRLTLKSGETKEFTETPTIAHSIPATILAVKAVQQQINETLTELVNEEKISQSALTSDHDVGSDSNDGLGLMNLLLFVYVMSKVKLANVINKSGCRTGGGKSAGRA